MAQYPDFDRSRLRKFVCPEILYGAGAATLVGQYVGNYRLRRCLVVTDAGVARAGWLDLVLEGLDAKGVQHAVFDRVTPNPRDFEVHEGAEVFLREGCDSIIAVGGGSPIDCAKGIGIVAMNKRGILEFEGVDKVEAPLPPLICLPTTAGSSADVSQFCIIRDSERGIKIAIVSKAIVPDVALIDPALCLTMSHELTAATGMDALTHAVEAYVSLTHSHISDVFALRAVSLIASAFRETLAHPESLQHRERMTQASMDAGLAFSNASLGAVHAMAHALGGIEDLAHGECNAVLLPMVIEANFSAVPGRYRDLAWAMGLDTGGLDDDAARDALVAAVSALYADAGLSWTVKAQALGDEVLGRLVAAALGDPCMLTNPARLTAEEVREVYEKALL